MCEVIIAQQAVPASHLVSEIKVSKYYIFMPVLALFFIPLICQAESLTTGGHVPLSGAVRTLAFSPDTCQGDLALVKGSQYKAMRYVPKIVLDELSKTRLWPDALEKGGAISEIDISQEEIWATLSYHENFDGEESIDCVKSTPKGLMFRWKEDEKWVGPFVELGPLSESSEHLFFKKIFGLNSCYIDQKEQRWIFASEQNLLVNGKSYPISLMLDTMETPTYGTVLRIKEGNDFWVFKPQGQNGWAVYRDTWLTSDDRTDPGPEHSQPWRSLKPCQN